MADKGLYWFPDRIQTPPFSFEARRETGELLRRLQRGERLSLPQSRPMPSIGPGVHELRVRDQSVYWRVVYFIGAKRIVILEIFEKKTQNTPPNVIRLCQTRLTEYILSEKREVEADEDNS